MERMRLSREIIETCLEMTSLGLNQGTAGNVSARYENGMLITPSGIPYERLTENMIVYVDNDGKYDKGQLPSSEWRFHRRLTRRVRTPMRSSITMLCIVRPFRFSTVQFRQSIT